MGHETWIATGGPAGCFQHGHVVIPPSQLFDCQPPTFWLRPLPLQHKHLLFAPSHPHDSRDPQATGADDTCQQRDRVSDSSLSDSCTHLQASYMSMFTHTHTHFLTPPDSICQRSFEKVSTRETRLRQSRCTQMHTRLTGWLYRHDALYKSSLRHFHLHCNVGTPLR